MSNHRDELERLEMERLNALADLEVAHARVTASATAIDEFWNRVYLNEAASGEIIAWF
jgi:hypothetical protein